MFAIDLLTLTNWLVSGLIGFLFGAASAWMTHRYQRKRDDIAWEREKEKLRQQFQHDRQLLETGFQQQLKEFEQQQRERIREKLTKGLENPALAVRQLLVMSDMYKEQLLDHKRAIREGKIPPPTYPPDFSVGTGPSLPENPKARAEREIELLLEQVKGSQEFLAKIDSFFSEYIAEQK